MIPEYYIIPAKYGFQLVYRDKRSKWSISIESMVPRKKRTKLEHYYIIVRKDSEFVDRFYLENGTVSSVTGAAIPNYVYDIVTNIIGTGDVNYFLQGRKIDNEFTRLYAKKTIPQP